MTAILPSAVDAALASGLDMKPIPKVSPEQIADAVVASVGSRKAEIAVPGYVGGLANLASVTPEPILNNVRSLMRDRRALGTDNDARTAYRDRLNQAAHGRAESERSPQE